MAQFQVEVVADASDSAPEAFPAPRCFKCKKADVVALKAADDAVIWICPKCQTEGRISNWQVTLWDLRERPSNPR